MPGRQFPQVEATLPEATGDSTAFADFPAGAREEDLVSEPFGAAEPGDQTPGRRRPRSAPSPVCPDPIALDRLTAAVLAEHHHGWQDFDRRRLCEGSSRNSAPRARPTPAAPSPRNRTSSTGHTTRWDTADLDAARVRSACVCQHADPRTGLTATRTVEPIGEVPFRRRGTYDPSRRQDLGSRPARQGVEEFPSAHVQARRRFYRLPIVPAGSSIVTRCHGLPSYSHPQAAADRPDFGSGRDSIYEQELVDSCRIRHPSRSRHDERGPLDSDGRRSGGAAADGHQGDGRRPAAFHRGPDLHNPWG